MFAIAGRHQGFETFCNASDCCVSGLLSGSLVRNCSLFRNSPFRTLRRLVSELCRLERGTAIWRCTNLAHTRGSCCVRRSAAHCNRSSITLCLFAGMEPASTPTRHCDTTFAGMEPASTPTRHYEFLRLSSRSLLQESTVLDVLQIHAHLYRVMSNIILRNVAISRGKQIM